MNLDHQRISTGDVRLHCAVEGKGPVIILLHGFPEFWYGWKNQISEFARDFRVVAPDMRGYNTSDKPGDVNQYRMNCLTDDVKGLIQALGEERVVLAGHDWGGIVAWAFAMRYPEYLSRLIILNAPHPLIFARELQNNLEQQKASEYIEMFKSPRAEEILSRDNYLYLRTAVFDGCKDSSCFSEQDRSAYLKAWSQPGALTGGLNYYRANPLADRSEAGKAEAGQNSASYSWKIKLPTLVIWGEKDIALTTSLLNGLDSYVEDLEIKRIPEATHWVQHDSPEIVNQHIWAFLA
jgi:pimeloyl-ACP methyl ester carboxylesterase